MPPAAGGDRPPVGGWLPDAVLATGWVTQVVSLALTIAGRSWGETPWIASTVVGLAAATLVRRRRPAFGLSAWFAVVAGGTAWGQLLEVALVPLATAGADPWVIAATSLTSHVWIAVTIVAAVNLFTVFPDGVVRHARERWVIRGAWGLVVVPVVVALATPEVVVPWCTAA